MYTMVTLDKYTLKNIERDANKIFLSIHTKMK